MSVNRVARRRTTIRFTALSEEMLKEIKKKLPHDCNVTISECEHIFKCTNELDRIKAIQLLKTDIKTKMMIREYLHLDDFQSLTGFRYWKYQIKVDMKKLKNKVYNFKDYLEIWGSSIKTIEGRFGTGVGSYFRFLKSLFFLQIPIFLLYFGVILIPQLLSTPVSYIAGTNKTITDLATTCRMNYTVLIDPNDYVQMGLDFIQGTGWMEKTIVFYGSYSGQNILINNSSHYNMPLAYFCVTIAILLISIFFIVNSAGSDISSQLINRSIQKLKYCEMIITFWDFGLNTKRAAKLRLESFEKNVAGELYEDDRKLKHENRTNKERYKLYIIRAVIITSTMCILGLAAYIIYLAQTYTEDIKSGPDYGTYGKFGKLLIELAPSLTITVLNVVIPVIFSKIVEYEQYSAFNEIKITLLRIVYLKLASLIILLIAIFVQITCATKDKCLIGIYPDCPTIKCWETYVGQQIYKLVITDFFVQLVIVFAVETPRKFFINKFNNKLTTIVGLQIFDIPKNVLDLVFVQTLCWIGAFFSPIIVFISVVKLFMLFYIKKFTTLHNYKQSEKPFPAASSNAFFMIVLLTAYLLTTFPIVYMLYSLDPSKSCGPFMSFNRMINVVYISYISWNTNFKIFIDIITNSAFIVALLIIFIAIINQLTMQNIASKLSLSLIKRQIYETEQENRRLMKSKKTPKVNKPTTKSVESKNIYEPEIPTIKNDKIGVKKSISAWDEDSASSHRIESEQPSEEHYDYETNKAIKNKFDVQKENNKQKSSDEDVISIRDESSADAEENENKSSEVKLNVQDKNVSNPMPDDYNIPSAW